eukprot:gb/GECH01003608.1/.p1 GENE.gb/GECH01003608.1/~~gb/GECH01003608.1/.p1  ORF type:complete len:753 (+),score=183.31 gb/GECH01003608.1/:1-2259(+)
MSDEITATAYDDLAREITTNKNLLQALYSAVPPRRLEDLASCLVRISLAIGTTSTMFDALLRKEFEVAQQGLRTILRANSLTTKVMDSFVKTVGQDYLKNLLNSPISRVLNSNTEFELNPDKLSIEDGIQKQLIVSENTLQIKDYAQEFVDSITSKRARETMPSELRLIAGSIGELAHLFEWDIAPLIGSFVMLRLFNPVIVFPDMWHISQNVTKAQRRNLILISKILQNLSNGLQFGKKEEYMRSMNFFIERNQDTMNQFLLSLLPGSDIISDAISQEEEASHEAVKTAIVSRSLQSEITQIHRILDETKGRVIDALRVDFPDSNDDEKYSTLLDSLPSLPEEIDSNKSEGEEGSEAIKIKDPANHEKYQALLRKAKYENLSDIEERNIINIIGQDKQGRKVCLFVESRLPPKQDLNRVLLYIVRKMDQLVDNPYVVVYCVNNNSNVQRPQFSWLRDVYRRLTRKYKKNMKDLFVLHPTFWMKLMFRFFRPFLSTKFYRKLHYLDRVSQLYSFVDKSELSLPPDVLEHDIMNSSSSSKSESSDLPHAIFGVPLSQVMNRKEETGSIPRVLANVFSYLEERAPHTEGIFRIPGNMSEIQKLKIFFDNGDNVDLSSFKNPHIVSGVLKLYLRELPSPILPFNVYDSVMDVCKSRGVGPQFRDSDMVPVAQSFKNIISTIPQANRAFLRRFLGLLYRISQSSESRMTAKNLGIVFGMALLKPPVETSDILMQDSPYVNVAIEVMIAMFPRIFTD